MKKYKNIRTLEILEGAENYNSWIASRLKPYIKSPALEIGAGTGNISYYFTHLKELVLTDIDEDLVASLRLKFSKKRKIIFEVLNVASNLGKISNTFNTIYSVNVLEHIENDEKALRNMHRMLNKSGTLVLLVPAKRIAYNDLDRSLGHFRRYEKEELRKKIEKAGFTINELEYFNVTGLLSWILRNYISNSHAELKGSQVKYFNWVVPILRLIEPRQGLPFGISLIAVARK